MELTASQLTISMIILYILVILNIAGGIFIYYTLRNKRGPRGFKGEKGSRGAHG